MKIKNITKILEEPALIIDDVSLGTIYVCVNEVVHDKTESVNEYRFNINTSATINNVSGFSMNTNFIFAIPINQQFDKFGKLNIKYAEHNSYYSNARKFASISKSDLEKPNSLLNKFADLTYTELKKIYAEP
jgi:hypothetical protein